MKVLRRLFCCVFVSVFWHALLQAQPLLEPFQISEFHKDGATGWNQGAAYNSKNNEYLVAWSFKIGNALADVYAQRIDAETGAFRGDRIIVNTRVYAFAFHADVAYNPIRNEYLVLFTGQEAEGYPRRFGKEIYAQRINADTGEKIGLNIRISDVGFEDRPEEPGAGMEAQDATALFNERENQYLVVWWGTEAYEKGTPEARTWDIEWEIFGQFLSGDSATDIGPNDFRISTHGPVGDPSFIAKLPALSLNTVDNQYLVTWALDQPLISDDPNSNGIFGRRIDAHTHNFVDAQFRIDTLGQFYPPVAGVTFSAFNPVNDQYLVTWIQYDVGPDKKMKRGNEIFSQRLDGKTGAKIGERVRLSRTGFYPESDDGSAYGGAVIYNPFRHQYVVVWDASHTAPKHFLFGQAIDANTGFPMRDVDYRFSHVPSLTAVPGMGRFIEPFIRLNTQREGFALGWLAWNLDQSAIGVWGQLFDASSVDAMNTHATPTPTPTATPTMAPDTDRDPNGNPKGNGSGDLKAAIKKAKKPKGTFTASCKFTGTGTAAYSLTVHRAAAKTLTAKDKIVAKKSGVLAAGESVSLYVKAKPKAKPSYLVARCVAGGAMTDTVPKNNVSAKKLPKS